MVYRQSAVEFFSVGHDAAETEFHPDVAESSQNSYSMLFCGIGDARNLFATLAYISLTAMSKPSLSSKKFYFTLLDINPAVFARDLLNFRMLADCVKETDAKRRVTLVTISYVFALQIMPPWVYERLQAAIQDLLSELQDQKADVLGRFGIDGPTRKPISHHLRNWRKVPEGWYSTASFLASTREQNLNRRMQTSLKFGSSDDAELQRPPGCGAGSPDVLAYEELSFLLPFVDLLEKFEPQILKIFMEWGKTRRPASRHKLDQYIETNWKPNMTLIDFDWEMSRVEPKPLLDFVPQQVVSDLFGNIPAAVAGSGTNGVLAHLVGFFDFVATWSERIKKQTVFEIIVDDMSAFMERAEHGVLHRDGRFVSLDASTLPGRYDAVHMSNIPDYVGGPLTTFVHGLPLLRRDRASQMTANVLRNVRQWTTHAGFLCEYLLLDDRQRIEDTFAAALAETSAQAEKKLDGMVVAGGGAVMGYPFRWQRTSTAPLAWHRLLPRPELERWVHAHVLKLCLPAPRPERDDNLVFAPLNLGFVFRLVAHLHRRGYPAHWLAGVLSALSTGTVTTRARAPRAVVVDGDSARRVHPPREMSLRPFVAEFRTLLALWRRLLPFGTQVADEAVVPGLQSIHEYRMSFRCCDGIDALRATQISQAVFLLVFWNKNVTGASPPLIGLREVLLDDGDSPSAHQKIHSMDASEFPVHVLSTWTWKSDASVATFWFADGVVEDMLTQAGHWEAYIYRSDSWRVVIGPLPISRDTLIRGKPWC